MNVIKNKKMKQQAIHNEAPKYFLIYGERLTTIPVLGNELENKGFDPEYSLQQEYGSIANGVRENRLNGNGVPLTDNAEGEYIVLTYVKT